MEKGESNKGKGSKGMVSAPSRVRREEGDMGRRDADLESGCGGLQPPQPVRRLPLFPCSRGPCPSHGLPSFKEEPEEGVVELVPPPASANEKALFG